MRLLHSMKTASMQMIVATYKYFSMSQCKTSVSENTEFLDLDEIYSFRKKILFSNKLHTRGLLWTLLLVGESQSVYMYGGNVPWSDINIQWIAQVTTYAGIIQPPTATTNA